MVECVALSRHLPMHLERDQFIRSREVQVVGDTGACPNIIIISSSDVHPLPPPPPSESESRVSIAHSDGTSWHAGAILGNTFLATPYLSRFSSSLIP